MRQGARRWDVVLDRGQVIELPETEPVSALERVLAMQDSTGLLTRDVAIVDIRDPARLTVRLGPAAAENLETTRSFGKGIVSQ